MQATSFLSKPLVGTVKPAADKSISHRAVIIASLTKGTSYIYNLLSSEDITATINWAKSLGVKFIALSEDESVKSHITKASEGTSKPSNIKVISDIDINDVSNYTQDYTFFMGNSGTSSRLLLGVMAGFNCNSYFYGDASLHKRPMLRVITPLLHLGVHLQASFQVVNPKFTDCPLDFSQSLKTSVTDIPQYLPIKVNKGNLTGGHYKIPVASAQVKSAILLASLFTDKKVVIHEPILTRDHTENMLTAAGVSIKRESLLSGGQLITVPSGRKKLQPQSWQIPNDISAASFIIVAALLVPDSKITLVNVNLNPLRSGLLIALKQMGANITIINKCIINNEPAGDITVEYTKNLKAVHIIASLAPLMIDEFPILACLAATLEGTSIFNGISELQYKESNRILAITNNLKLFGVKAINTEDSLIIVGNYSAIKARDKIIVNPGLDHRIAMSFLILGLIKEQGVTINNTDTIATSFPNFIELMVSLGANIITTKDSKYGKQSEL